jgi:hypothetical protein
MKQLKVSMDEELRAMVDAAAASSGRSLGEEIRCRLWSSFVGSVHTLDIAMETVRYQRAWDEVSRGT